MGSENNISLTRLTDELAKVTRRLDAMQKQLDLLFADREILETIQGRITGLEEQVRLARQQDNEVRKDIREEINVVGDRVKASVETKVEEIQNSMKKVNVLKPKKRWFMFWHRG